MISVVVLFAVGWAPSTCAVWVPAVAHRPCHRHRHRRNLDLVMAGHGTEPGGVEARLRSAEDEVKELNLELEALRQLYADKQDAFAALAAELESVEGGCSALADASVKEIEQQLAQVKQECTTARTDAFRAANEAEDLRSELAAVGKSRSA